MATITNYWAGLPITGNWAWHIAHALTGGTDYETVPGTAVRAPVTGVISFTGNGLTPGTGLSITYQPGYAISVRELASITVKPGQKVTRGQVIGHTSEKYSHIDITIHGVRHDWTPYITPVTHTTSTASTGTVKAVPKPTPKGIIMKNWSIIVERNIGAGATSTTLPKAKNLGIFLVGDGAITEINTQAMNELAPILAGARGDVSTGTFGYIKAHLAAIQK